MLGIVSRGGTMDDDLAKNRGRGEGDCGRGERRNRGCGEGDHGRGEGRNRRRGRRCGNTRSRGITANRGGRRQCRRGVSTGEVWVWMGASVMRASRSGAAIEEQERLSGGGRRRRRSGGSG
ncbi:hypothetical protein DAI22_11g126350 [Oryza sativa Japonica Group]|nr:hypothetical protein DAI22_11g126350 [Oryza sativa Japonica Group]